MKLRKTRKAEDEALKTCGAIIKKVSLVFLFFNLGWLIPTTKEMVAILVVPKIANNEKIQQLPDNLLNLVNDWIKELEPKKDTAKNG